MHHADFVGRHRELTQLLSLGTPCETTPIVLLGAAAGMGKSRLVAEYRAAAGTARGFAVGACLEFAAGVLAPLRQVIRSLTAASPATVAARPKLFERLDALSDRHGASTAATLREEKLRAFELYGAAIGAFANDRPTTIVLEDVQWADQHSLDFIHYLAQDAAPNLVAIATYRNDELTQEGALRALVGRISRLPAVCRIDLPPLADDDIDLIVGRIVAGTSVDKAHRNAIRVRAEGNPFFAEELARHVRANRGGADDGQLPLSIVEAVSARLLRLPAHERVILFHAAVAGRRFDATVVAAITGEPLSAVLDVLRRARDLAFIDEIAPPKFAFRHALTREAFSCELLETQRRAIHAKTLEILESRTGPAGPAAKLAYHAWAARDAVKGVEYGERSGDDAAKAGAFFDAADAYERALDLCGGGARAARLGEKLAVARLRAGFPARAIAAFLPALDFWRLTDDRAGIADCALGIADAYAYLGDEEQGLAYIEQAQRALATDPDQRLHVRALLYSARIALVGHQIRAAFDHLSAAEEFSASFDTRSALMLYALRADAKLMQRRYDEAIADQERAVELAACDGDGRSEAEQRAQLGSIFLLAGRLRLAAAAYRAAYEVAEKHFDVAQAALYQAHYAEVRLMLGDTEDAKSIVDELLALAVQTENPAFIVLLGRIGIFISLRTGDAELGSRIVERLELDERFALETPPRLFPISGAYAQWLLEAGRAEEAKAVLRRAVDRLSQKRLRSTDWSICTLMTVAAIGSIDDVAAAREVLAPSFSALGSAFLSFFDALTSLRAKRENEARAFARAAANGLRSFEFRYEEAVAWELAGEKQTALDLFTQQGAHKDVRRLQRSMLSVNRRGRAEDELTARERDIARAIVAGDTNRMIAERFCITEKTVETHVASIFNRLGVRSRGDVAARFAGVTNVDRR